MVETKLKQARKKAGLSQSEIAKAAAVNLRMYQYYEQGKKDINAAKIITLLKICNVLHCALPDIISDEETLLLLGEYEAERKG